MRQCIFKAFSVLLIFSFLLTLFALNIFSEQKNNFPDTDKASAICLYNLNTDKMVYCKNINTRIFPSGAVKMIAGLIACEMLSDRLSETITVTEQMLQDSYGASIKLKAGMSVTAENLLYGVLCGGGNDASLVLAALCSGSVDAFVDEMNRKCGEWGLKNTVITNPTGIDDSNMYSSLSDIMIVAKIAYANDLYMKISSEKSYSFTTNDGNKISFSNKNKLISSNDCKNPYTAGMCVGNTDIGGCAVITSATLGTTEYICAVVGANEQSYYQIANNLIYHALDNLSYVKIASSGTYVCSIDTRLSLPSANDEATQISCVIKNDIYALTDKSIDIENDITYRPFIHNEPLNAPIEAGMIVGGVDLLYNGEVLGHAFLVTDEDLPASEMLLLLENMKSLFTSRIFIFSILFFVILYFLYRRFIYRRLSRRMH